jgi:hypothetical protein
LAATAVTESKVKQLPDSIFPNNLFTLFEAEKILGKPARLTDSLTSTTADALTSLCGYAANNRDKKTEKTSNVYFLFEHYNQVEAAQKKSTFIKTTTRIMV